MAERSNEGWTEAESRSLSHAWDWFALHAAQRLQMFNFFCVTTAFLVAAFVTADQNRARVLAGTIALGGAAASVGYNLLEQRTKSLVRAAEQALTPLQARLADLTGVDAVRILAKVERPDHRLTKYSFVFNLLQRAAAVAWLLAALVEWNRYS